MPFPGLADRVQETRQAVADAVSRGGRGQRVEIVAVTKTHGPDAVVAAFEAGLTSVGENRVQEALDKMEQVRVPVRWHLIGHLQRNKAKHALRFSMVHSVDSGRLADALDKEARQAGKVLPVLLQVNVTGEASKGGYARTELEAEADRLHQLKGLEVRGVMTMARLEASEGELRDTFSRARGVGDLLRRAGHDATELSMGMSGDYLVAVEEGATLVRLGTILFGAR